MKYDISQFEPATNGVLEVTFNIWEDLAPFTKYFAETQGYIFRGQANSTWGISTTLDRYLDRFKSRHLFKDVYQKETYLNHLNNFKTSLQGRGIKTETMPEHELWALGQHYGLYTPLLDWSYSFYIALFFAFSSENNFSSPATIATKEIQNFRSVYALSSSHLETVLETYNADKPDWGKFEIITSKSEDNPRVISQAGLFTKLPFDFQLKQWVEQHFKGKDSKSFIKININNTERKRVLQELNLMNINPKTIFPDLQGAALNCNFRLYLLGPRYESIY